MALYTDKPIQIKDEREKDFYIAQRALVRHAGKIIKVWGCAVYNSLLSHADEGRECWPGLMTIATEFGMSRMQVIRSIDLLASLNMIRVYKEKGKSNKYHLIDAKYWRLDQVVTGSDQSQGKPVTGSDQLKAEPVTGSDYTSNSQLPEVYPISILKESIERETSCGDIKKPKRTLGSQVDYPTEINKVLSAYDQETKIAVQLFIDGVASQNKTGEITQGRYLSLLCELSSVSATTNKETFIGAIQKAIKNEARTVNYVKTIVDNQKASGQSSGQGRLNTSPATVESYEGKKYIVYGEMKGIHKTMIMCSPQDVATFLGLSEAECILMNGISLESKGIDPLKYQTVRPTDDMFERIYQEKIEKEQGDKYETR
jgi:hypothetical protein